jgi:hypothetical protein
MAMSSAHAQPSLFDEGLKLIEEGKPAEACAKLEAALEAQPEAPGVMLNLGVCNEQQNKIATALKWYRRAQTRAAERGLTETETAAKQKTVALAKKVPAIKLAFSQPLPAHTVVMIDGATIDPTAFPRLEIDAGAHVAELHGPGLASRTQPVDVADQAGEPQLVTLEVVREQTHEYVEIDRGAGRRHTAFVVGGIGAGLAVAGGAFAIVGRIEFDGSTDLDTRKRWKSAVHYGGSISVGLGLAAVGVAAYLYKTAPGKERVERTVVVPAAGDGAVGVSVVGAF